MNTNQEFKNEALAALKGNWAPAVLCTVVLLLLSCIALGPSYVTNLTTMTALQLSSNVATALITSGMLLAIFIFYPLMVGYTVTYNKLFVEADTALTGNMFKTMFNGYFRNVWGIFLMYLFISLWSLLLLIPGIIKTYSYAMTPYILQDYPELSANQAINLSRKMMKGHKFDFFWLTLSFIGWAILCFFTFGIGYVWLMPYVQTTSAAFYQEVKKEYNATTFNN